tara:strand:+ start:1575 stop:2213 length:639 start_codon:yes stop_codon:yes gene_type:complete
MKILSNKSNMNFFSAPLSQEQIINVNSDLKHRVFPRPFERLSSLCDKRNLVGVEVGVAGGEHALSLLENLNISMLYLIDPYEMYEEYVKGEGSNYGETQLPLDETFLKAEKLLDRYEKQTRFVKKLSNSAVKEIEGNIDFIYIDGNHDYKFVKEDLELYYPIVKSGGVIGGHDFYNGFVNTHDGVVTAVIEFVLSKGLQLYVEQPDFWFYKP